MSVVGVLCQFVQWPVVYTVVRPCTPVYTGCTRRDEPMCWLAASGGPV